LGIQPLGDSCSTTSVTFVGFSEGPADIHQGYKVLWRGHLAAYAPSTDLSGHTQICADASQDILIHVAKKSYRASLRGSAQPFYILVDARVSEPAVQDHPFLLD